MNRDNAGRSDEDFCDELLARHGDYLDGLLAPHDAARLQLHMEVCPSCARYDRVVRRGMELVRDIPEITPSAGFELRLQQRILHAYDVAPLRDARPAAGAVATFAVASVLALLAWSPLLLSTEDGVAISTAAETRPVTVADGAEPLPPLPVRTQALRGAGDLWQPMPALSPLSNGETVRIMAALPGPYSPLVVSPPVHGRSVRTISTEHTPID